MFLGVFDGHFRKPKIPEKDEITYILGKEVFRSALFSFSWNFLDNR